MPAKKHAETPRTVDSRKITWHDCAYCDGKVGGQDRKVLHSNPACATFVKLLQAFGIPLEAFQDVGIN